MTAIATLLDVVAAEAAIQDNASADLFRKVRDQRQADGRAVLLAARTTRPASARSRSWSEADDEFLRRYLGVLSIDAIAAELNRTVAAVEIRWKRELRLTAPGKDPDYLTGMQAAKLLGLESRVVVRWIDEGLLAGDIIPYRRRCVRRVSRRALEVFVLTPDHWPLLKLDRIRDERLRRLLALRTRRWGDEWWDTNRAAAYHGVENKDIQRQVVLGKLPAVHVENMARRNTNPRWARWFVRRSDVVAMTLYHGKGAGHEHAWNPNADAYIVLASAVGIPWAVIAHNMGRPQKTIEYRLRVLKRKGLIKQILRRLGGSVQYKAGTGKLWAPWPEYARRFPALARTMARFEAGHELNREQRLLVFGALRSFAEFHARTKAQRNLARSIVSLGRRTTAHLRDLAAALAERGIP